MKPDEMGRIVSSIVRRVQSEMSTYTLDREDLFSYGMLIVCEKYSEWDSEGRSSLSTYLYTQVYGNMRNYASRKVIPPINQQVSIEGVEEGIYEDVDTEGRIALNQIEEILEGRTKEVFLLCREGLTYREVAERVGISHQAVGHHIDKIKRLVDK